ncbi:hypothetical protein ABMA28_002009 [Loxostege sticticalis]|uniref:Uncharacterized protein n=1 Tax=Loxostege sticticalis TaxID=481309 RepID=A0ABD0SZF3_LOXSC
MWQRVASVMRTRRRRKGSVDTRTDGADRAFRHVAGCVHPLTHTCFRGQQTLPVIIEPETIQFDERRVGSLGDQDEPVVFKKRKLHGGRNARQKLDDD